MPLTGDRTRDLLIACLTSSCYATATQSAVFSHKTVRRRECCGCYVCESVQEQIGQVVAKIWALKAWLNQPIIQQVQVKVQECIAIADRSSRVVSASDCGVRGARFESHCWRLCLSLQLLRYTALGTGYTPLLRCLGRLNLPPSVGW